MSDDFAAPGNLYAPPAARVAETLPEEHDWPSFANSRRIGIIGCAAGAISAFALGLTARLPSMGFGHDADWMVGLMFGLLLLYGASLLSLWGARRAGWLRALVCVLQLPLGLLGLLIAAGMVLMLFEATSSPGSLRFFPWTLLWVGATTGLPPLAFWVACLSAWRRQRLMEGK